MRGWSPSRFVAAVAAVSVLLSAAAASAQRPAPAQNPPARQASTTATIHGIATTQGKSIRLPGVTVTVTDPAVTDAAAAPVSTTVTDGEGTYTIPGLAPGSRVITLSLDGFESVQQRVTLAAGQDLEVSGDLSIAKVTEHMEVVQEQYAEPMAATLAARQTLDSKALRDNPLASGSLDSALMMLAGVVFGPEGLSIRGGRPSQSSTLMGASDMSDASVGVGRYNLPSEAVATVEVLPNPYAVEFGRFSSGVTLITTRRGGDSWHFNLDNLDPGLMTHRDKPWKIMGIKVFAPHAWFGGPILKDKLFLAQTNHFEYRSYDIQSRPDTERMVQKLWSSFTRLDYNAGPGHTQTLTVGIFPEKRSSVNLDTFTPPSSAFDITQKVYNTSFTDTRTLSGTSVFETSVQLSRYSVQIGGVGLNPMVMQPSGITGTYFNRQGRDTNAVQWVSTLSGYQKNKSGEHLLKAGLDVLYSHYDGESSSLPVEVRRQDGTLARLISFSPASHIERGSADMGVFVQDRWRPLSHLLFEIGGRLDRDGALGRFNLTPRTGVALLLKQDGSIAVRGGIGLFYERTPLVVRAFDALETRTETRFAADGVTPLGPPIFYANRIAGPLKTPVARTWNVEYDHRINPTFSYRVSYLERRGAHELVVNPLVQTGGGELLISSTGVSKYREAEFAFKYSPSADFEVSTSYTRSSSQADLNNYVTYFGAERNPVVSANEFGPTPSDVPNRLVGRFRVRLPHNWTVVAFGEIRNGFPFTAVNEIQDVVGLRNRAGRFPTVALVDMAVEHKFKLGKWSPWIGVKLLNAFDGWAPLDVQRNIASPNYGTFYNPIPRQIRLTLRID